MLWKRFNPNPRGERVGDCTVRALCFALGKSWEEVYTGLYVEGYSLGDMPSSNAVWGAYLMRNGFKRHILEDTCPACYTVADFCKDHPKGLYVLAISGHVVAVLDGDHYDSWDSSDCIPLYYWQKERE